MFEKNSFEGVIPSNFDKPSIDLIWELLYLEKALDLCPSPDKVSRRLMFLGYELKSDANMDWSQLHKAELLRDFAIVKKGFKIIDQPSHMAQASLSSALERREACTEVSALIWVLMGAAINLKIQPLELERGRILKVVTESGDALYIDLANDARYLEDREILRLLESSNYADSQFKAFDRCLSLSSLIAKICLLQTQFFDQEENVELLIKCYEFLIKLEPMQPYYLSEKAKLLVQMGDRRSAHQDLKRYFFLTDEQKAPEELRELYEDLCLEFEVASTLEMDDNNH